MLQGRPAFRDHITGGGGGGGGGGGNVESKLCIEARGKVHFEIVIATVVRNFDLISIQRSSRDMI